MGDKREFEAGRWYPITTAPHRGKECLVWWPIFRLDDDGGLTDEQIDGERMVSHRINGRWAEPTYMEACGGSMGDDFEFGEGPTMWSPIPDKPQ